MQQASSVLALLVLVLPAVIACGGFKLDLKSLKSCGGGHDVLQLSDGFRSRMTDECQVEPEGCVTAAQDVNKMMVTYDVVKNGMVPLKGSVDACQGMEEADDKTIQLVMTLAGIPPECPLPKGERCSNGTKTIDVTEYMSKMAAAAGSYKGRLTSDHGEGKSSCVDFEASLKQ